MKSRVFICLFAAFATGIFTCVSGAAVHKNGIKVINNFNYGGAPIRSGKTILVASPAYVQHNVSPEYVVPVAVADDDIRPSVLRHEFVKTPWWYAAVKYVHTLSSFTSKHYTDGIYCVGGQYCEDKFSFEPMMGFAVSAGKWAGDLWRFELEGGYTGEYSDSADDVEFRISAPYLSINALYNFGGAGNETGGFYIGPGLGVAWTQTGVSAGGTGVFFFAGGETKREISPMLSLNAGYQLPISERIALDIGYRLWAFGGTDHSRDYQSWMNGDPSTIETHTFTNKTGWLINNSLSLGLRWYF
jgi:opacity protein-like surface antigen